MKKNPLLNTPATSSFAPPADTSGSAHQGSGGFSLITNESDRDRVHKWFIEPLMRMQRDDGFIILMVILPLYERHLRVTYSALFRSEDESFYESHKIFGQVKQDLNLTTKQAAFDFWRIFRNGLMHRAVPNKKNFARWEMAPTGIPVTYNDSVFRVDPLALRDHLLRLIEPNRVLWSRAEGFPFIYQNTQ